jgi:hypothetical protein
MDSYNEHDDSEIREHEDDDDEEDQDDFDEVIIPPSSYVSPDYSSFSREKIRDCLIYNLNYKNNRKLGSKKYDIRSLLQYFAKELKEAAERMAIILSDDSITHYMATNFANMKLKDYVADQYWGYVSCLIEYFLLIGDFESVLILLPNPPTNTPSPDVHSCVQFVKFKGFDLGTPIQNGLGEIQKDICGDDIHCLGLWNQIGSFTGFSAALSGCMQTRNQRTGYTPKCDSCHKLYSEWKEKRNQEVQGCAEHEHTDPRCNFCAMALKAWTQETKTPPHGCIHHSHAPQFFPIGNPFARCQDWKNAKSCLKEKMKTYKSTPATMLTPFEFNRVIRYLIFSGCIWQFQLAVCLVVGTRLYLREMELASIKFEHLQWNLSSISECGLLCGIMLNLHNGKTDLHPSLLMLWASEDAFPLLDPVWLLMLWLKFSKISAGYLFASKSRIESETPLEQGILEGEQLSQDMLDTAFRKVALKVLGVRRKFTGRSCRPTAFCIDTYRGAEDASLQIASRSAGPSNVARYSRGARGLLQLSLNKNPNETSALKGTFKQPFFESENMVLAVLGNENLVDYTNVLSRFFSGVPAVCKDMETCIRFFIGELYVESPADIKKSLKEFVSKDEFNDLELNDLDVMLSNLLQRVRHARVREHYKKLQISADDDGGEQISNIQMSMQPSRPTFTGKTKLINEMKSCSKKEKIEKLMYFFETNEAVQAIIEKRITSSTLKCAEKTWFHQTLYPLVVCVKQHHNNSIDEFLRHHSDWTPSKKFCGKSEKSCLSTTCSSTSRTCTVLEQQPMNPNSNKRCRFE